MKLLLLVLVACNQRAPIESCEQNLQGVWLAPGGERWMILDNKLTLEAYPMFDDVPGGGSDLVVAPRLIDLSRAVAISGEVKRRYMKRDLACVARAPVHVLACKGDELELTIAQLSPPLELAPCRWPMSAQPQVERWRRD